MLCNNVQIGIRQQVVNIGDAACNRVLDRDHSKIGLAGFDRIERVLKRAVGHGLKVWKRLFARDFRVRAAFALECDLACHFNLSCDAREGNHAAAKSASALFLNRKRPE